MKLSRIKTLIKERKTAVIMLDDSNVQWIGDGISLYPADGDVVFNKENILSILDIDRTKREQYIVQQCFEYRLPMLGLEPHPREIKLYPDFSVDYLGDLITLMHTEDGLVVGVNQKRIAPAYGELPLEFTLRPNCRGSYVVACYEGMLCTGIIKPEESMIGEAIMKWLEHAINQPRGYIDLVEVNAEPEEEEEPEQMEIGE